MMHDEQFPALAPTALPAISIQDFLPVPAEVMPVVPSFGIAIGTQTARLSRPSAATGLRKECNLNHCVRS